MPHPMAARRARILQYLSLAFIAFMLWVALSADRGRLPDWIRAAYAFPNGDKVGHFCLYGLFGFLGALAWPRQIRWKRLSITLGALPAIVFACIEEITQVWMPNRTPDLIDLGAGLAGIAVATWVARRIKR